MALSNPNVLADRYASAAMRELWSSEGKIRLERAFWLAVLKAQQEAGLKVPEGTVTAYENAKNAIDLDDMRERERISRHDVKARLESFNAAAGQEHLHKGLTSRDLTENVEQLQLFRALNLLRDKAIACLVKLSERANETAETLLTARTHNVAAQPTTFGKRLAMFGQEMLLGLETLQDLLDRYSVRGLKGAVGTQLDLLTLLAGDREKVAQVEAKVAEFLGLPKVLNAVGQVYPRSLDHAAISALVQLGSGPSSFAKTLRLMAGHETASEGFAPGQTGSSAMPHKMNSRSCERLNGFHVILKGHLAMIDGLAGDQWNEGDVSCSVVRRVALPDACFAADGLLETFLSILGQMEVYPKVIAAENDRYLPFLLTTTLLMEAVKAGGGREAMHEIIKEHAVATVRDLRAGAVKSNDLFERLAADSAFPLERAGIEAVRRRADELTGLAKAQVAAFRREVAEWTSRFPAAVEVQASPML